MEAKHYSFKVIRSGQSSLIIGLTFLLFLAIAHPAAKWISTVWPIKVWGLLFYIMAFVLTLIVGKWINKAFNRLTGGKVDFCIQEDTIAMKWIRPIRFRKCSDRTFQLKDIERYSFSQDHIQSGTLMTLPFFKIILKEGFRISFDPKDAKDKMFEDFITAMLQGVEQYNNLNQAHPIKFRLSIYRRKTGLIISVVFLISFLALPFFLARIPTTSKLFWVPVGLYYLIAGMFIMGTLLSRLIYIKRI